MRLAKARPDRRHSIRYLDSRYRIRKCRSENAVEIERFESARAAIDALHSGCAEIIDEDYQVIISFGMVEIEGKTYALSQDRDGAIWGTICAL
jgi:hypothetical protein